MEINLPPCRECSIAGDSWCFDCDQCNVDAMYNKSGQVRADYI